MSDNWITIIPEDPEYVPPQGAQEQALVLFKNLAPNADEVIMEASEGKRFFDCCGNFSAVVCPKCGSKIGLEWWADQMDAEEEVGYTLQPVRTPCCGSAFNLNELKYDWPQGFARFSIEARNPGISVDYCLGIADLSEEEIGQFELILGCKVRKILAHI